MPTLPTPPERPDTPLSPEDALRAAVTDYVLGEATPEERAALEARMATDPATATLVDDVRAIWALPLERFLAEDGSVISPAAPSRAPAPRVDVAAAWARFEAQLPPLPSVDAGSATISPEPPRVELTAPQRAVPSSPPMVGEMVPARPLRLPPAPRRWRRRARWAALTLFVALGLWREVDKRYLHPAKHYHAGATAQTIVLPDHTIAWLAPGTYLGTDGRFLQNTRTVYLFGQARFTVAHDPAHPFIVRALNVRATALGTTFTMTGDTTARVTVTVQDGKVSVDLIGATGATTHVAVLAAGQVRNVLALSRWFVQAGKVSGLAGVPGRNWIPIQDALYRAAAALAAQETARER